MIGDLLRAVVPRPVKNWAKDLLYRRKLLAAYYYDYSLYLTHGDCFTHRKADSEGEIIKNYHIVEKGLTMPETRLGFGADIVRKLIRDIERYVDHFGTQNDQVEHAVRVLLEYKFFHGTHGFELEDQLVAAIDNVAELFSEKTPSEQFEFSSEDYISETRSSFEVFSRSRRSVRNYGAGPVEMERIFNALELAKTAPSACNRQAWRTYVFTRKEQIQAILDIQGGSRGFSHLADKLIVITSSLSVFMDAFERNQAYVDGGIYAMNLLHSLHYNQIAACILNCSHWPEKDRKMRKATNIRNGEVFIAMIACGNVADKFSVACSPRKPVSVTNVVF